jgi:hypothetical protein
VSTIPKTKTSKKTAYRTVQVPEDLVELILELIPGFYRNHHEAIIEWIRIGMFKLIKARYMIPKLLRKKKIPLNIEEKA